MLCPHPFEDLVAFFFRVSSLKQSTDHLVVKELTFDIGRFAKYFNLVLWDNVDLVNLGLVLGHALDYVLVVDLLSIFRFIFLYDNGVI